MRKFKLVFSHVYRKNVKSGTWIFMVLLPILMLAFMTMLSTAASKSRTSSDKKVAIVAETNLPLKLEGIDFKQLSAAEADKKLKAEKIDAVLTIKTQPEVSGDLLTSADDPYLSSQVTELLSGLKWQIEGQKLKLSPNEAKKVFSPAELKTKTIKIEDGKIFENNDNFLVNIYLAMGITVIITLIVVIYGSIISKEIATEKGTRIMESLLSAVNAKTQFYGKIAAVLALLFTQVAIYAVAIMASWPLLSKTEMVSDFMKNFDFSLLMGTKPLIYLLFLLVGTISYAVLAALSGSLVSSIEQAQMAAIPISIFSMAGYVFGFMATGGDSILLKVMSYVPFVNISVMPVQLALNHATIMEAVISLAISVVFAIVFTMFVAKVYRSNVLVYSESGLLKGLKRSIQIMRAEKN